SDRSIVLQLDYPSLLRYLDGADDLEVRRVTRTGTDESVLLHPCEPIPAHLPELSQVVEARVPAVEDSVVRIEPSFLRCEEHVAEMLVLGLPSERLVVDAIVCWH